MSIKNYPFKEKIDRIICCNEEPFAGHHFCISEGKRHWIYSPQFYEYFDNVNDIPIELCGAKETLQYPLSHMISACRERLEDSIDGVEARAFVIKDYKGRGLEFGAANVPSPFPLGTVMEYADIFKEKEEANAFRKGEFVPLTYHTSIDDMEGIPDAYYDFIAGSPVIEHSKNPIRSIALAHKKLKAGGKLFLVVPHKEYTFDNGRKTTELAHLIKDYKHSDDERDAIHILEFMTFTTKEFRENLDKENYSRKYLNGEPIDIHYHTFTERSFEKMIDWIQQHVIQWQNYIIHPRIDKPPFLEFYVELTK